MKPSNFLKLFFIISAFFAFSFQAHSMNGTYTINPSLSASSTNYLTFTSAISDLRFGTRADGGSPNGPGISGAVVFNVASATYNETLTIQSISGTNASNTITFSGQDRNNVILTSTAAVTVTINGANRITFENMTVNNTTSGPSLGFHLYNQANYNTIRSNNITVSTVANSTNVGIAVSSAINGTGAGNNANYLTIEDNEIIGGYYGIGIMGQSTTVFSTDFKIINNKIHGQYLYGMRTYYLNELLIEGNEVDVTGSTVNSYGIMSYYCNNATIIKNKSFGNYMGFQIGYHNVQGPNPTQSYSLVANNMARAGFNYSSALGAIYCIYSNNLDLIHNSLHSDAPNTSYALYLVTSATYQNIRVLNNIFHTSNGNTQYAVYNNISSGISEMDFNVYNTNGTSLVYFNGGAINNLESFQSLYPQFNKNSYEEDPDFIGSYDLRIPNNKSHFVGNPNVPVQDDIFGTTRCFFIMGVYELELPVSPAKAEFHSPDTAYVNSPVLFLNNPMIGEPQYDQWFVDGNFVTGERNLKFIFSQFGVYEITLVAENCEGDMDTLTKSIVVANPVSPPVTDFISNKIFVARGENVSFTDMSTFGPEQWQWKVTPDQVLVFGFFFTSHTYRLGTNNQSQNPVISFSWPGLYSVELEATNLIGSDVVNKTDYISVGYTMCPPETPSFLSSSESKGLLFDDGGPNNYTADRNCNFVIDPCADTLFLIIEEFKLRCNQAFLRIWDGKDNSGKPLHCLDNSGPGFTGGDINCSGSCLTPDTLILLSGQAYIEFETGSGPGLDGFKMRWFTSDKLLSPQAMINIEDTICSNSIVNFENASVGSGLHNFSWHYGENDVTNPANWHNVKHGNHTYVNNGNYNVSLAVEDCSGFKDTTTFEIAIVNRSTIPNIDFVADNLEPIVNLDIVKLYPSVSGGCNDTYAWNIISSGNYRYMNGTDSSSRYPQIMFESEACYDVELHVSNVTGTAVEYKSCYITALNYCIPYVNDLISSPDDIGISRVILEDINNSTTMGTPDKYKNFSHLSTSLERGQTYTLRVERSYAQNPISWAAWIDYNIDRKFSETELIGHIAYSTSTYWLLEFRIPEDAKIGESRLRIGTNYGNHSQFPCGPHAHGEFHDYTVIITPDVTPPVITLEAPDTVFIQVFFTYIEPGYSAWDDADGDLTTNVIVTDNINTSIIGTYEVEYFVSDLAGNSTTVQRPVIVFDTIWPEISLIGDDTMYLEVHNQFPEPGVNTIENYLANPTNVSSNLNISKIGTYFKEYCVTDVAGNGPVCITRIIIVEDTTPPEVELIAEDTIVIEVYHTFNDPWLDITDNYWGAEDITIDIGGTFENTDTLDLFYIRYTVTDGSGNSTTIVRFIRVVDTTPPIIALNDTSYLEVMQWSEYIDPWVVVSDNFDADHQIEIFTDGNFTGTHQHGMYYRTYYAVDRSGNVSDVKLRQIFVMPAVSVMEHNENEIGMSVYPNPSTGEFKLNLRIPVAINGKILITDLLGREIKTVTEGLLENKNIEIDLSDKANGVYLIRLETSEHLIIEKISITR